MSDVAACCDEFESQGFIVLESLCPSELTNTLLNVSQTKLNEVLNKLEGKEIGIGSAAGYKEVCQRSLGRWDVPIDLEEFGLDDKDCPWWKYITKLLGVDAKTYLQGVVSSAPKTPAQFWHIDSPHRAKEHLPVHAINVLIALEDIDLEMGPTQIAIGTHKFTNHLDNPKLVPDELVYQCEKTTPDSLLSPKQTKEFKTWTSPLKKGSVIIFDDRILHRGGANQTDSYRHVAYFSYSKSDYAQESYFESDKTLS